MKGCLRRTLSFNKERDSVEASPSSTTNRWRAESSFLWSLRIFAGERSSIHWLWSLRMKTVSTATMCSDN